MTGVPNDRQCYLCDREAVDGGLCEHYLGKLDDGTDDTAESIDTRAVREHYKAAADALAALGDLNGVPTGAFAGNAGWYHTRPASRVEDVEDGFDGFGRAKTIVHDYNEIVAGVAASTGGRSLYALTTYADTLLDENRYTRGDDPETDHVELPEVPTPGTPDDFAHEVYYTWNVRVNDGSEAFEREISPGGEILPAPDLQTSAASPR